MTKEKKREAAKLRKLEQADLLKKLPSAYLSNSYNSYELTLDPRDPHHLEFSCSREDLDTLLKYQEPGATVRFSMVIVGNLDLLAKFILALINRYDYAVRSLNETSATIRVARLETVENEPPAHPDALPPLR